MSLMKFRLCVSFVNLSALPRGIDHGYGTGPEFVLSVMLRTLWRSETAVLRTHYVQELFGQGVPCSITATANVPDVPPPNADTQRRFVKATYQHHPEGHGRRTEVSALYLHCELWHKRTINGGVFLSDMWRVHVSIMSWSAWKMEEKRQPWCNQGRWTRGNHGTNQTKV